MLIGFPVSRDNGFESPVYSHFGCAPFFILVDTERRETQMVTNRDRVHLPGACRPLKALGEEPVDAVVVSSIGARALEVLLRAGLKVYQAQGMTVADNITCMEQIGLKELAAGEANCTHARDQAHLPTH